MIIKTVIFIILEDFNDSISDVPILLLKFSPMIPSDSLTHIFFIALFTLMSDQDIEQQLFPHFPHTVTFKIVGQLRRLVNDEGKTSICKKEKELNLNS